MIARLQSNAGNIKKQKMSSHQNLVRVSTSLVADSRLADVGPGKGSSAKRDTPDAALPGPHVPPVRLGERRRCWRKAKQSDARSPTQHRFASTFAV